MKQTIRFRVAVRSLLIIGLAVLCNPGVSHSATPKQAIPPVEKIQAGIDQYLAGIHSGFLKPFTTCYDLSANYSASDAKAIRFKDTQFETTPASYLIRIGQENDPKGTRRAQFAHLEKHGLLQSKPNEQGGADFTLTWPGYTASFSGGCLYADQLKVPGSISFSEFNPDIRDCTLPQHMVAISHPRFAY